MSDKADHPKPKTEETGKKGRPFDLIRGVERAFLLLATVVACYVTVLLASNPQVIPIFVPGLPTAEPIVITMPVMSTQRGETAEALEVTREVTVEVTREVTVVVTSTLPPSGPVPSPIETSVAGLLFQDDFEDGLDAAWEVVGGDSAVVSGRLTTGDNLTAFVAGPSWTNYKVQFGSERGGYSFINSAVFVRVRDIDNLVAFRWGWGIQGRGGSAGASWFVRRNGVWEELPNSYKAIGRLDSNRTILIKVQDNKFTAYIDGELIGSFITDEFPAGGVGIELAEEYLIDDFQVTAADS